MCVKWWLCISSFSLISLNSLFFNYETLPFFSYSFASVKWRWFCYITAPSVCPEINNRRYVRICRHPSLKLQTLPLPLSRLISSLKPNFDTRRIQSPVSLLMATSGSSTVRHYYILVFFDIRLRISRFLLFDVLTPKVMPFGDSYPWGR